LRCGTDHRIGRRARPAGGAPQQIFFFFRVLHRRGAKAWRGSQSVFFFFCFVSAPKLGTKCSNGRSFRTKPPRQAQHSPRSWLDCRCFAGTCPPTDSPPTATRRCIPTEPKPDWGPHPTRSHSMWQCIPAAAMTAPGGRPRRFECDHGLLGRAVAAKEPDAGAE